MGYGVAMRKQGDTSQHRRSRPERVAVGEAQTQGLTVFSTQVCVVSIVSRESARNRPRGHPYRACTAQVQATSRACQPRRSCKLLDPWLWQYVLTHLTQGCSPEQIA